MTQNTQGMRERFDERFYDEINSFMGATFGDKKLDDELKHFIEQEISLVLANEREEIIKIIDNQISVLNPIEQKDLSDAVVNVTMSITNKVLVNLINNIKQRV